ncbi:MAG: hypothetical protein QXT73_03000 [Candidatus Methanomethylicaceae archaeon]
MPLIPDHYDDLSRATKALKKVLDADSSIINQLSPIERLLANHIRESAQGDPHE